MVEESSEDDDEEDPGAEAIKAIEDFTNWEIEKGQEADAHLRKLADARRFIESVRV